MELKPLSIDTTKHTGVGKWYGTSDKHYGFITPTDGSKDIFVHIADVGRSGIRELKAGDRVQYEIKVDEQSRRACATNLRLI
jgi:CspA family cold shock protein